MLLYIESKQEVQTLTLSFNTWYKTIASGLDILFNEGTFVCVFEDEDGCYIVWQDDICVLSTKQYLELVLHHKTTDCTYEDYIKTYKKKAESFVISQNIDLTPENETPLSKLQKLGVRFS